MKLLNSFAILLAMDGETWSASATETCRALAMAGGGSKGAFEIGALWGMYYATKDVGDAFDYDVLSGVSAGSINSFAMSLFPKNETQKTLQVLSDTWERSTMIPTRFISLTTCSPYSVNPPWVPVVS